MLKHELLKELTTLKQRRSLTKQTFDLEVIVDHLYKNYLITSMSNQTFLPLAIPQFLLDKIPEGDRQQVLNQLMAHVQEAMREALAHAHYDPNRKHYVISGSY